jgi:hypothetical protein
MIFGSEHGYGPERKEWQLTEAPEDLKNQIYVLPKESGERRVLTDLVHQIEGIGTGMSMRDKVEEILSRHANTPEEEGILEEANKIYGLVNSWEAGLRQR